MAIASVDNKTTRAPALSLASSALLIGALPAVAFGLARGLLYGHYFELGLYRTAFLSFTTGVDDYAVVVPAVFLIVLAAQVMSARLLDQARADETVRKVMAALVFGLLVFTGYRLNRSPWYPDYPSLAFFRLQRYRRDRICARGFSRLRAAPRRDLVSRIRRRWLPAADPRRLLRLLALAHAHDVRRRKRRRRAQGDQ